VHVEASGYYPADSIAVSVPPAVTDLHVGMTPLPAVDSPPTVAAIVAPATPVAVKTVVSASAPFSDPDILDKHTAVWDWGDGSVSKGVVNESRGSGTVLGTHAYVATGVYTVNLTVTDQAGLSGSFSYNYIVVYDPSVGFVTGSGWINSPAGAYAANPALAGKATFGFVSKYQKGASVPTGQTEFHFQMAGFDFQSTAYQWLIVAGAKAQYKGSGTVNGVSGYNFILTATDGAIRGGGGVDKFRIHITSASTGATVYDNVPGAADDINNANPEAIAGGNIVIHSN
jgi:PKD repeat protein